MANDGQVKSERGSSVAFTLPPFSLEILDGDIAAEATDAIVNAANNEFWMGAGVAGAICRGAAGNRAGDRSRTGQPGECVITRGGRLAAAS
jgi:O-acetyl-ADP-ribose deacetylase (regulator of RNase III)